MMDNTAKAVRRPRKIGRAGVRLGHLFLIFASLMAVFPIYIMISGSFKPISELFVNSWGPPRQFTLDNYSRLLNYNSGMIVNSFLNSVLSLTSMLGWSNIFFTVSVYPWRGIPW